MKLVNEREGAVYDKLVALAGSSAVVENVVQHLSANLGRTPSVGDIAQEIVGRRARAEMRRSSMRSQAAAR
jgi:hypothetical protein